MRCKDDVIRTWNLFNQHADQIGAFNGGCVSHGIGDVDCCCTCLDRDFNNAAQIVMFSACGIHGRPLDIVTQIARMCHCFMNTVCHLILIQIWDRAVQWRCADECVDARAFRIAHGLPTAINIAEICTG